MKRVFVATVVSLVMTLGVASANGGGGGRGGPGGSGIEGPREGGGDAIVTSDGTIIVTRTTVDASTNTASTKVTAIRSTGVTAWTVTLANRADLVLSGSNVINVTESRATDGTYTSTLTALSTLTGATAWTLNLSGRLQELEPFSGGTYAIVVVPGTTSGATATRSLVGISPSGAILFTVQI